MSDANKHVDDIDLLSLIRAIIATKNHVLITLFIVSAVYWGQVSLTNLKTPPIKTASISFNFTFKGAEQSQYPNNSPFRQSDLIAPIILNKVYDQIDAGDYISRDLFVSGFTILPYIPDIEFINAKYDLDKSGLNPAELEQMQQQLLQEIRQASLLAGKLEFTTRDHSIPSQLIANALKSVPRVWADHMVNNVGVTQFDVTLFSERIIDPTLLSSMDHLVAFELILDKIAILKQNINEIMELPNGKVASDPETGLTAPDLLKAVKDTENFSVDPLLAPIRYLNVSESPQLVQFYFLDKLENLQRDEQLVRNKLENLKQAYSAYVNNQSSERNAEQGGGNAANTNSVIPQFGTEFLDRLVTLTNAGADISFRQKLTEEQVELGEELARIGKEATRIRSALEASRNPTKVDEELKIEYLNKAQTELPLLFARLADYFAVSSRIYSVVNENSLGSAGMFHFVSEQAQFKASSSILSRYTIRNYLIIMFLSVLLVIPTSMVYRALRKNPEQT